ncbi:MAG TPA: hypothetical protein P5333_27080, partial [Caldilinea sp.]|nr:hypothetical protein [Caldilinea sp.]
SAWVAVSADMVTCVSFGCCRHLLLLIGLMESATVPSAGGACQELGEGVPACVALARIVLFLECHKAWQGQ